MTPQQETEAYLLNVQAFAGRSFLYRNDIGTLIDLAEQRSLQSLFDKLIFLAKFASNSHAILQRLGMQSDETAKLSAEFSESLRKISSLLSRLIESAPPEVQVTFKRSFLDVSHDSLNRLLALLSELAWIKNYSLDTGRLPFATPPIA